MKQKNWGTINEKKKFRLRPVKRLRRTKTVTKDERLAS